MPEVAIFIAALGFSFMGVVAILRPELVSAQFGIHKLSINGRNEVRAVYGGFGIAAAAALSGMASGRILSFVLDRGLSGRLTFYLVLEAFVGSLLWFVA